MEASAIDFTAAAADDERVLAVSEAAELDCALTRGSATPAGSLVVQADMPHLGADLRRRRHAHLGTVLCRRRHAATVPFRLASDGITFDTM